ncbi:MAG: hypothetical protein ACFFBH_09785 [Promethearchaeota archaeon]
MNLKDYRRPIIIVFVILIGLIVIIAVGFPLGILSQNPDGLERVLIDYKGNSWLENLFSPWIPFLAWIENDYLAGIIGIILTTAIIISVFYLITFLKKRKIERN